MKILLMIVILIQGGSSTHWDAQHAFDEGGSSSSSTGFLGFLGMLVVFMLALFIWGRNSNKK